MSYFGYYLFKKGEFNNFCKENGLRHEKINTRFNELHSDNSHIGFNKINLESNEVDLFSCSMMHTSADGDNDLKRLLEYKIDDDEAREICINGINFRNKQFTPLTKEKQFLEMYQSDIYTVYSNGEVNLYYDGLIKLFRDLGLPSFDENTSYGLDYHADFLIYDTKIQQVKDGYIVNIETNEEVWNNGFEFYGKYYLEIINSDEDYILCKTHNLI